MIDVTDVGVTLGARRVLDGVSVAVEEGELLGLIGPNGAGKTTLLRTISGVLTPDTGCVRVGGDAVADLGARARGRRVAVVPQSTELSFDFTVREVVEMGRTPYSRRFRSHDERAGAAVDRALARTETDHLAERHITAVSGGERKRVTIARAVAQETPILLLDEPTASLDINYQLETFELVEELIRDGKAGIAAVHDLDLAARYCDRLLLLAGGTAVAVGPPESVLTGPRLREAYGVRTGVRDDPVTGSVSVTPIPDRPETPGIRVHVIGGGGAACPLLRTLDAAGYVVSVGVVERRGPEHRLVESLGGTAVTVPPAAPIDADAHRRNVEQVRSAPVTVVADVDVGPLNRRNLTAATRASRAVIVAERPFHVRNHAGPRVADSYAELVERHPTIAAEDLVGTVAEVLTTEPDAASRATDPSTGPSAPINREI